MAQLLVSAKSDFLLEAPLEVLHEESLEWLEEIEFWKDETAFFYTLMITKSEEQPPSKSLLGIQNHIIYLSAEKIDDLKLAIQRHERYLAGMLKSKRQDEGAYRAQHKAIAKKVHDFEMEMREMKKKVFAVVKKRRTK